MANNLAPFGFNAAASWVPRATRSYRLHAIAARARSGAPDRYYAAVNLSGCRNVPPEPFWDLVSKQTLELAEWPNTSALFPAELLAAEPLNGVRKCAS